MSHTQHELHTYHFLQQYTGAIQHLYIGSTFLSMTPFFWLRASTSVYPVPGPKLVPNNIPIDLLASIYSPSPVSPCVYLCGITTPTSWMRCTNHIQRRRNTHNGLHYQFIAPCNFLQKILGGYQMLLAVCVSA